MVRVLALLLVTAACGGKRAECDATAALERIGEGRVERGATMLRELVRRCPGRTYLIDALASALGDLGRIDELDALAKASPSRATVIAAARARATIDRDPQVLAARGLEARKRGDLAAARRLFDRARSIAEEGGERASVVSASPQPRAAVAVAFGKGSDLVAAGSDGRIWHIDVATHTAKSTPPPEDCMRDGLAVAPDQRALFWCHAEAGGIHARVEAASVPAISVPHGRPALAAADTAASAIILDHDGVQVWSLPTGAARWATLQRIPESSPIAIPPAGDRLLSFFQGELSMRDTTGNVVWRAKPRESLEGPFVFSPDGRKVAVVRSPFGGMEVRDAATGVLLDELRSEGAGIAFGPGERIAYWRTPPSKPSTEQPAIAIRDLSAKRDVATRRLPGELGSPISAMAWSRDGAYLAAVTADAISIWTDSEARKMTVLPSGDGVALVDESGHVELLGDTTAARAVLGCRVGAERFPFELCEDRAL